jgi:outer membrane lipoprotein-sorting protein
MKRAFGFYLALLTSSLALTACANDGVGAIADAIADIGKQAPGANAAYANENTQSFSYSTAVTLTAQTVQRLGYYTQGQSPQALRSLLGSPNRIEVSADGSSTEIYKLVSDGVSGQKLIVTYTDNKGTWYLQ